MLCLYLEDVLSLIDLVIIIIEIECNMNYTILCCNENRDRGQILQCGNLFG